MTYDHLVWKQLFLILHIMRGADSTDTVLYLNYMQISEIDILPVAREVPQNYSHALISSFVAGPPFWYYHLD